MNSYYPIVKAELKALGFILHRKGKGSHEVWVKGNTNITLQFNLKSKHTANGVLKQAGSTKRV